MCDIEVIHEKELIETVEELIKVIDKRSYDMTRAIEGITAALKVLMPKEINISGLDRVLLSVREGKE